MVEFRIWASELCPLEPVWGTEFFLCTWGFWMHVPQKSRGETVAQSQLEMEEDIVWQWFNPSESVAPSEKYIIIKIASCLGIYMLYFNYPSFNARRLELLPLRCRTQAKTIPLSFFLCWGLNPEPSQLRREVCHHTTALAIPRLFA